jgi:hypothetical protein
VTGFIVIYRTKGGGRPYTIRKTKLAMAKPELLAALAAVHAVLPTDCGAALIDSRGKVIC